VTVIDTRQCSDFPVEITTKQGSTKLRAIKSTLKMTIVYHALIKLAWAHEQFDTWKEIYVHLTGIHIKQLFFIEFFSLFFFFFHKINTKRIQLNIALP